MSIETFEKWKNGMRPSEKFLEGLVFTPKYMMRGLNNTEWIAYIQQKWQIFTKMKKPF